jgi:phage repressor protein C with HTH and peptisase S24 domain
MDELQWEADVMADLLGDHILREPEKFPLDERIGRWAAVQAIERQTISDREQTQQEAVECAARIRQVMLAARLGDRLPLEVLLSHPASVRGRTSMVRKFAHEIRRAPLVETAVAAGNGTDLLDEVSETWVELPGEMPKGDYIALPVIGDSMEPFLLARDVVLVKLGPDVARDTVIVARKNDGYVVKYVSSISDREVELASLEASYPTVRVPRLENRIVGTVVARLRRG